MPLFDTYVMVDWSARNRRSAGKPDCIWIAHGDAAADAPTTVSPPSRTEAEQVIASLLRSTTTSKRRALVCVDFAYGYPAGFASLLRTSITGGSSPWHIVWEYLRRELRDDLETKPGRKPTNRSNRFDVANAINVIASSSGVRGPFWCLPKADTRTCIPQSRPPQPFSCANGAIAARRRADTVARSDTPFRLFGTGSVGSQVLTGIPRLVGLRYDPHLSQHSKVWPFETGWAPAAGPWLGPDVRVLHAEIYPSVRTPYADTIKDRGQVRAMWHWARDLDIRDLLVNEFAIPPGVAPGSLADVTIRSEEGWILGCRNSAPPDGRQ